LNNVHKQVIFKDVKLQAKKRANSPEVIFEKQDATKLATTSSLITPVASAAI
jgi:hypothetical protein